MKLWDGAVTALAPLWGLITASPLAGLFVVVLVYAGWKWSA